MPDGAPVAGYVVHRDDTATGVQATVDPACSEVITSTSCTETARERG